MSAPALAVAFFDPARELYGTARSGTTVLFEGRRPTAAPEGPAIEAVGDGWRAELPGRLRLDLEPVAANADLGAMVVSLCRVRGEIGGRAVDCLGTASQIREPPAWEELDALRSVTAIVDDAHAALLFARRPRGAPGHGDEEVSASLLDEGRLLVVSEARISTVYDSAGRQRSAGLELWVPGEEYPRRGSGLVLAGSSLDLDGLQAHVAIFRWRLDGREGTGAYELMVRTEPPAAA